MKTAEEFWDKVDIGEVDECWYWKGEYRNDYRTAWYEGKSWPVHRLAWMLTNGPIPEGMCVCHHCDHKACCSPHHLFTGSHRMNMRDATAKGRMARGEANGMSKLTELEVKEIRRRYSEGDKMQVLAREFDVSQSNIGFIVRGVTWKHLPMVRQGETND